MSNKPREWTIEWLPIGINPEQWVITDGPFCSDQHEEVKLIEKSAYDELLEWYTSKCDLARQLQAKADKLAEALELHLKFFEVKTGELLTEDLFIEMQSMSTAKKALAEFRGEVSGK